MNINQKELSTIMKYLGWKKIKSNMFPRFKEDTDIFILNGFIAYKQSYYITLNGQMPILLAQKLFDQYNNMEYKIRVNGNCENDSPKDSSKEHMELQKFIEGKCNLKVDGISLWTKKIKEKTNELLKNDYENFYIEKYHIDTTEGLRIITEFIKENNIQSKWYE